MGFDVHDYEADSVRMRYYTAGEGRPLLFLHGGGVRAMTYRKNLELLAQRFYVIAPDIPPFGASSMPSAMWDFVDYANFFSQFCASLGLEKVAVAGNSFGGGIALCLAAECARIERVVVIDTAGISMSRYVPFFYRYLVKKSYHNLTNGNFILFVSIVMDFFVTLFKNLNRLAHGFRLVFHALDPHYEEIFSRIRVPTLILWGNHDEVFAVADAKRLQALIPGSEARIVSGNHDWCLFAPEKLDSMIV